MTQKRLSGILDIGGRVEPCIANAEKCISKNVVENHMEAEKAMEGKVKGQQEEKWRNMLQTT